MAIRRFDETEMKLVKKVVDGKKAELKHLKLMVEYNRFMLDKMLESNYLEKRRGFATQTKDFLNEIEQLEGEIQISQKQMKDGIDLDYAKDIDEDEVEKQ